MKIAILSTPWIAVPPKGYGGIEKVVYHLAEGLVKRGHEVMLFATGDSETSARLEYEFKKALGNHWTIKSNPYFFLRHLHKFFKLIKKERFDVIHNNAQYIPQFFCDLQDTPFIHTLHGAFYKSLKAPSGYIADKIETLKRFKNHPYVSISNHQRTALPELNYVATVYNGIDPKEFKLGDGKGGYLAWLGRITYNKGVDIAIKVAYKAGIPLKIAAFVDKVDMDYYKEKILPLIKKTKTEMIGEIKDPEEKTEFLGKAIATLFPIRWHEPFGLVMIESMASGTPVIAFNKGSVPEVIEHGKTGFIVNTEEEMLQAIKKISIIDRKYCHKYTIEKFSVDRMVDGYIEAYRIVLKTYAKQ